jgi:hypothetical protein
VYGSVDACSPPYVRIHQCPTVSLHVCKRLLTACERPEAWLIGDFNDWTGTALEKDDYGVWSCSLPDNADGTGAIPHGSHVKVRLKHWDGWTIDLVPAWIKCTNMPEGMNATFDGVHWDPPASEKHPWYAFATFSCTMDAGELLKSRIVQDKQQA